MVDESRKRLTPPYVSYASFTSFIKGLSETHVPDRIDKTVMSNYSGSTQYALLPALQWLGLIDEHGNPQTILYNLAGADEDECQRLLQQLVKDKYSFVFDGGVDLEKASSGQVIDAFKRQDISGSTVTKSISFFLAIAKAAGIKISSHVKAPTIKRSSSTKTKKAQSNSGVNSKPEDKNSSDDEPPKGTEKISFSLRGKPDVVVYFPEGLEGDEAKQVISATIFNLKMYYGLLDVSDV